MEKKNINIKKVALVYLMRESDKFFGSDDLSYKIQRRPQLGLQYLSSIIRKNGFQTAIFDQSVQKFNLDSLINNLKGYDVIGFYCIESQENKLKFYCQNIKKKTKAFILVGGPATLNDTSFLDFGCDIIVHGEGEVTIQHIVDFFLKKKKIGEIKGISYIKKKKVITSNFQQLIPNIDKIPFPSRSNINVYYDYFLLNIREPYITIISSRGCKHKCSFCVSHKLWNNQQRVRTVDNVIAEIDFEVKRNHVKYFAFQDDIFGSQKDWIKRFCYKLLQKDYKIRWMAILHPFSLGNKAKEILKLMKKSGCDTLSFGLQSANSKILTNIGRSPNEPIILRRLLYIAESLGFLTVVGYIFGLPGDTKKTIEETISYSINCGSTLANYHILSVLRNSEIENLNRNKEVCILTNDKIEKLIKYASKRFYKKLKIILKIAFFIIQNPNWLRNAGIKIPLILARIGFIKH